MEEKSYNQWAGTLAHYVANQLFLKGMIRFGAFKLKLHEKNPDAPLSPIYIDLRLLRSCPRLLSDVATMFRYITPYKPFDCYADVPTAATPIVAVLSQMTLVPMITPREAKTHGSGGRIDGIFHLDQTALVIDDLITKADSKLEAIKTLESCGLRVYDILVLIDREQGGREQLENAGYQLHAKYRISELLEWYKDTASISEETYKKAIDYLKDNK